MPKSFSFAFLVFAMYLDIIFLAETHLELLKQRYEEWKGCHPGFVGMNSEYLRAAESCQQRNLKELTCFISCTKNETGVVQGGKWNDVKGREHIAQMWDTDHTAERDQWYADTKKCADKFEDAGNTWPPTYSKDCSALGIFLDCILEARKCLAR